MRCTQFPAIAVVVTVVLFTGWALVNREDISQIDSPLRKGSPIESMLASDPSPHHSSSRVALKSCARLRALVVTIAIRTSRSTQPTNAKISFPSMSMSEPVVVKARSGAFQMNAHRESWRIAADYQAMAATLRDPASRERTDAQAWDNSAAASRSLATPRIEPAIRAADSDRS